MTYSNKSLGLTTLGVVGETLKGPAFEPMEVESWEEFKNLFGGTSTEQFKDTKYPKYELPYISKSFLSQSNQLYVTRVLGLSGYNAGPAWVIKSESTGDGVGQNMILGVIRSRGHYERTFSSQIPSGEIVLNGDIEYDPDGKTEYIVYSQSGEGKINYMGVDYTNGQKLVVQDCTDEEQTCKHYTAIGDATLHFNCGNYYEYDKLVYDVDPGVNGSYLQILPSTNSSYLTYCGVPSRFDSEEITEIPSSIVNLGTFVLKGRTVYGEDFAYDVSFNNGNRNYIYDVIGNTMNDNNSPIFVEELYDVALQQLVQNQSVGSNFVSGIFFKEGQSFGSEGYQQQEINQPTNGLFLYNSRAFNPLFKPVDSMLTMQNQLLNKSYLGKRYLWSREYSVDTEYFYDFIDKSFSYNFQINEGGVGYEDNEVVEFKYSSDTDEFETSFTATVAVDEQGTITALNNITPKNSKLFIPETTLDIVGTVTGTAGLSSGGKVDISSKLLKTPSTTKKTTGENGSSTVDDGMILVVKKDIDGNGKVTYNYHFDATYSGIGEQLSANPSPIVGTQLMVYVNNEEIYYKHYGIIGEVQVDEDGNEIFVDEDGNGLDDNINYVGVDRVIGDMNDYKEQYRSSTTPWFVSEMKGSLTNNEVIKLFRFHTISDGNMANNLVKVAIANIRPEDKSFDVQIRSFNDSDTDPKVLETFARVNLNPESSRFIGSVIGTNDGTYPFKSNHVVVELAENENIKYSFPCGFLGYPVRNLSGMVDMTTDEYIKPPYLAYNTNWDKDIKERKQYFGFSDIIGIDTDIISYKGRSAYTDGIFTDCFHLDSRVGVNNATTVDGSNPKLIDGGETGESLYLYNWQTVGMTNTLDNSTNPPQISSAEDVIDTIYEKIALRKFTVLTYGGFDGWDIYRQQRTTTDDFKLSNYKGSINQTNDSGTNFSMIRNTLDLNLKEKGITSDYYAFLAGIRSFANPNAVEINLLATPGIDCFKDRLLVDETIEMIEQERRDSLYVVTTPDKPIGASDSRYDMYEAEEVSAYLDAMEIESSYACTYYPWVRHFDTDTGKYIYLPVTKDVVRNIAFADNKSYPWYPPAGKDRGAVVCVNAKKTTILAEEDVLYENRINPVKTFNRDGVFINGQKTLHHSNSDQYDSPLTRISVRRLMLRLGKLISSACENMLFSPNDSATRATFRSLVTPILEDIKSSRGITEYRLVVDDTIEDYEQRQLSATIFIKPTDVLEYIDISFVVTPQGVDFNNL
ncbi:MAG: hypothetical protein M0R03_07890 [Novosphingobium sp.]|nr:hypothetical protein [Novosphingobium sp.]